MTATAIILLSLLGFTLGQPTPVVIWHGMGDNCCSWGMERMANLIKDNIPGIYVHSLRIGDNILEDTMNGFLGNQNDHIETACQILRNDPKLANGYHGMGFSQGGVFLRAVAQRCPYPPMKNLVSFGGPHEGVYGFPRCNGDESWFCDSFRRVLSVGAYIPVIQNILVQAQYWHDPLPDNEYRKANIFLADINQEREVNEEYKVNLLKLTNLILVKFDQDEMVTPKESQWFGFYREGGTDAILNVQDRDIYTKDTLGLRSLNESGRLKLLTIQGDHLQIPTDFLVNEIILKYFTQ